MKENTSDHFKSLKHQHCLSLYLDLLLINGGHTRKKLLTKQEHELRIIEEEDEMQVNVEKMNRKRKLELMHCDEPGDESFIVSLYKKRKLSDLY